MERISHLDRRLFQIVVTISVLGLLLFCTGRTYSQLRIMPVGDSITRGVHGSTDSAGYRRTLYLALTAEGYSVNFIGTQTDGAPTDFDRNHEGHSGWSANQVRDNMNSWLLANPADIILLHIGTNDLSTGQSAAGVVAEVGQILDRIDARSTATVVFLARIINRNDSFSTVTTQYNNLLQSLANTRIANGDRIVVVNQETALNYQTDMADAVHPNDAGYVKMGQRWSSALSDYLSALPIQIAYLHAAVFPSSNTVLLTWGTLSETNNYGFFVQQSVATPSSFADVPNSFVAGHGTTTVPQNYSWTQYNAAPGTFQYRLKQVDLDGSVHYTDAVEVVVGALTGTDEHNGAEVFFLSQNYPNPFNPSTLIRYSLPKASSVSLKVYNTLGQEVAVLAEGMQMAGEHRVQLNANNMVSGTYLYRLSTDEFTSSKKLVVLR